MSRTEKYALTLVVCGCLLMAIACSEIGRMTGAF